MKTFEITFTNDKNSGIYSANLCKAETAEQAKAYFQTLGNYEIVGISETNTQPKPGQPVHIVPGNWKTPEGQHPYIKEAIKKYEAETLATFADILESKTAGEILENWHLKQYTTPKTLEALQNCKPNEKPTAETLTKMKAKKAREEAKTTAKRFEKLEAAEAVKLPESVNICVEFVRSRVWGYNPHATVIAEYRRTFGIASGCGYDKESAAIASALNDNPEIMRILYDHAEACKPFPYAVHIFAGLPSFAGGCGVSCFRDIFDACGYEWRQVINGKLCNGYTITRKH